MFDEEEETSEEYEVVPKTDEQLRREEERKLSMEAEEHLVEDLFSSTPKKVIDNTPGKSSIVPQGNKVSLKQEKTTK